MSKRMLWIHVLALFALLAAAGCASDPKEAPPESDVHEHQANRVTLKRESMAAIGLEVVQVRERTLAGAISAPAVLEPNQDFEALVGTLITGRVSKVFVRLGDAVKKGQPLMMIEGIGIGEIQAQFIKAKAQLDYAGANLERQRTLAAEKISSQKSLQEAQAEYDKALADYTAEDKKIHSIGLDDQEVIGSRDKGTGGGDHTSGTLAIKSPIDGIVVERSVVIGQLVDESANAFRIMNSAQLWADGHLFEKDLPFVKGKPEILFSTTAFPGETFPGRLIYIAEVVDEQTRTVQVRAEISNRQRRLKSGMFGEMSIPIHESMQGLAVPAESVFKEHAAHYVFVAVNDSSFELRQVEPGIIANDEIEIRNGLRSGEKVASKGIFYVKSEWKKNEFAEDEH